MKNNDTIQAFYEVNTLLGKEPIHHDKGILFQKKNNIYHNQREFHDDELCNARMRAFEYAEGLIKSLCESAGEPYQDDLQARRVLQRYFRRGDPEDKYDISSEDYMCGISVNLIVTCGEKRDVVNIYGINHYDDNDKNVIVADLLFYSMELVRERRYYGRMLLSADNQFDIYDFNPIGGIRRCLLYTPIDWDHIINLFRPTNLFICFDTQISYFERLSDPLLVEESDMMTIPSSHYEVIDFEEKHDKALCQEWKRISH